MFYSETSEQSTSVAKHIDSCTVTYFGLWSLIRTNQASHS